MNRFIQIIVGYMNSYITNACDTSCDTVGYACTFKHASCVGWLLLLAHGMTFLRHSQIGYIAYI